MADPLRSYDEWSKSLRNFESWLGDAAPGAMDVDALIERRGKFLFLESKPWQGVGIAMGLGQYLALSALSELEGVSVWLVGETGGDERFVLDVKPGAQKIRRLGRTHAWWGAEAFDRVTVEQLQERVREWWEEASR